MIHVVWPDKFNYQIGEEPFPHPPEALFQKVCAVVVAFLHYEYRGALSVEVAEAIEDAL